MQTILKLTLDLIDYFKLCQIKNIQFILIHSFCLFQCYPKYLLQNNTLIHIP